MKALDWLFRRMTEDLTPRTRPGAGSPHPPTQPNTAVPDRHKAISNRFTYHAPTEQQVKKYGSLRTRGKELAFLIEELCPDSDEKREALVRLDEVIMHANAAIARHS